jgi:hypothetical protein
MRGENSMNRYLIWAIGGGLLAGATGLAIATAEMSKGPLVIAGGRLVNVDQRRQESQSQGWSEDQVRQKLQWQGWSNIRIEREGGSFLATASKDGQISRIAVDSQTGRLRDADAEDDDDDDDDDN